MGRIGCSTARVSSDSSGFSAVSRFVGLLGFAIPVQFGPCRDQYTPVSRFRKIWGWPSKDNKVSFG